MRANASVLSIAAAGRRSSRPTAVEPALPDGTAEEEGSLQANGGNDERTHTHTAARARGTTTAGLLIRLEFDIHFERRASA